MGLLDSYLDGAFMDMREVYAHKERVVPELLRSLKSSDPEERRRAIEGLTGYMPISEQATTAILGLDMHDPDAECRIELVRSLGLLETGDLRLTKLAAMLDDADLDVATEVIDSLADFLIDDLGTESELQTVHSSIITKCAGNPRLAGYVVGRFLAEPRFFKDDLGRVIPELEAVIKKAERPDSGYDEELTWDMRQILLAWQAEAKGQPKPERKPWPRPPTNPADIFGQ